MNMITFVFLLLVAAMAWVDLSTNTRVGGMAERLLERAQAL
ncbi:hypothetical protein [Algicella marina]|nr:hypothetical protein [Algicella marina]